LCPASHQPHAGVADKTSTSIPSIRSLLTRIAPARDSFSRRMNHGIAVMG
jgi:hypothetical protein